MELSGRSHVGAIIFQHADHANRAAVGLLHRKHERARNGDSARRMADAPPDYTDQMIAGIVAFRIAVTRVIAKSKLSQNRDAADLVGAAQGALADRMQQRPRDA